MKKKKTQGSGFATQKKGLSAVAAQQSIMPLIWLLEKAFTLRVNFKILRTKFTSLTNIRNGSQLTCWTADSEVAGSNPGSDPLFFIIIKSQSLRNFLIMLKNIEQCVPYIHVYSLLEPFAFDNPLTAICRLINKKIKS